MRVEGSVTIKAKREAVWKFLTDPHAVSKCAPGVESMEIVEPDKKFRAVAAVGFGSAKVTFTTDVEWLELEKPNRAKLRAHGSGSGNMVDVTSEMTLTDGPDKATTMAWWADVTVSGTIASLASRLMGSVSKTMANAFFDCARKQIEA